MYFFNFLKKKEKEKKEKCMFSYYHDPNAIKTVFKSNILKYSYYYNKNK